MKHFPTVFILFLFAILFSTCKKEKLEDYDNNWTGEWVNEDIMWLTNGGDTVEYILVIDGAHSKFGIQCQPGCNCNCFKFFEGQARINSRHKFIHIGAIMDERTRIRIIQQPYIDYNTGTWKCEITTGSARKGGIKMKKK